MVGADHQHHRPHVAGLVGSWLVTDGFMDGFMDGEVAGYQGMVDFKGFIA